MLHAIACMVLLSMCIFASFETLRVEEFVYHDIQTIFLELIRNGVLQFHTESSCPLYCFHVARFHRSGLANNAYVILSF
jgi:hypothetical protein